MSGSELRKTGITSFAKLRAYSLYVVTTILYIATLAGIVYTIDQAYYTEKKWNVITRKIATGYVDRQLMSSLSTAFRQWVEYSISPNARPEEAERMLQRTKDAMVRLVENSPVVTAVTIEDPNEQVQFEVSRRERIWSQHDLSNSLFFRSFERSVKRSFNTPGGDEPIALFRLYLTSAKDDVEIQQLTSYWRRILLLFMLSVTIIYVILLRWFFTPLQRVTVLMQFWGTNKDNLIRNPSSLIERSYNDLARDATLTRFSKELRDRISGQGISYAEPVLEWVPELVSRVIGVEGCQIWTFSRKTIEQPWRSERCFSRELPWLDNEDFRTHLKGALESSDPTVKSEFWQNRMLLYTPKSGKGHWYYCDLLATHPEFLWLFVVQVPFGQAPYTPWWVNYLGRVAHEVRYSIGSIEDQRRLILQEKSKANISLSRNLGHDLTNIIATSKLELMTVRTFLSLSPAEISASPKKEKIFRESLEALLNNTRFLQEIVNLYRSFSFLQKPKFEETDVSELVEDVVKLYRPSLSRDFHIETHLAQSMPQLLLEPRLLRLALFNILTNATEAIKRSASGGKEASKVIITTKPVKESNAVEIIVEDTGPGIRDAEGKLMTEDALSEIFRLGFSTKVNQEGEGLGLNWVQTIVREFHGGEITARNREEGGACFIIRLPSEPVSGSVQRHQSESRGEPQGVS